MHQKRLVTIQDISCIGKCSLTAALPIISAFGIEAVPLPTAVLSTHTGANFTEYTFRDLTDDMVGIYTHWQKLGARFDAIYSGYLASIHQLDIVEDFFKKFSTRDNLIFVDPVMGDEGRLYAGFNTDFAKKMRSLCAYADIICPNVTEAAFLSGIDYCENHDTQYVESLAYALKDIGAKSIIITGLSENGKVGSMCFDTQTEEKHIYLRDKIEGCYYGTGDIFASVLCSALTYGLSLYDALKIATDFVYESILNTQDELGIYDYGVKFEQKLHMITDLLKQKNSLS